MSYRSRPRRQPVPALARRPFSGSVRKPALLALLLSCFLAGLAGCAGPAAGRQGDGAPAGPAPAGPRNDPSGSAPEPARKKAPETAREDVLGIYFDPDGTVDCANLPAGEHFAYLVLWNPSVASGIRGWECAVEIEPASRCVVADWGLQGQEGQVMNVARPPEFRVALGHPLPAAPTVILADIRFFLVEEAPVRFRLRPLAASSLPETPCYSAAHDPSLLVPMTVAAPPGEPVARINEDCTEATPWRGLTGTHD